LKIKRRDRFEYLEVRFERIGGVAGADRGQYKARMRTGGSASQSAREFFEGSRSAQPNRARDFFDE
jgi:hypothetical protein